MRPKQEIKILMQNSATKSNLMNKKVHVFGKRKNQDCKFRAVLPEDLADSFRRKIL